MALIGSIIKGAIHLKGFVSSEPDFTASQEATLRSLLEKAQNTLFGQKYNFEKILAADDIQAAYSSTVPFHDYNSVEEEWWSRIYKGEENVTWPGTPPYYALSSGTTGSSSKRIPVTEDMVESIRSAGVHQVTALSNFKLPAEFFEKEILMLGSCTELQKNGEKLEGEISGISAGNIPFWFKGYYRPGEEISCIQDWDERVERIAENAIDWDIGAISGIPSWMELMLKRVIEYYEVETIHDVWPNLMVYTSGGVAFDSYKKSFNKLLKHPIQVIDTYLASEGFLACQTRPETDSMQLIVDNGVYFEFVPFKPEYIQPDGSLAPHAPIVPLSQVEEGCDYVLVISTVAGTWRYLIGDTIKFTDVERCEIKITGRTKFFLNVVGSQLSVNKMNDAMRHLEEKFNIQVPEFTIAATRIDGEFYHTWYLGTTNSMHTDKLASAIDEFLANANKNYKVARSKALKGVRVNVVAPEVFHEWNAANKKKGGQVKMERVMNEEKFGKWEEFVKNF